MFLFGDCCSVCVACCLSFGLLFIGINHLSLFVVCRLLIICCVLLVGCSALCVVRCLLRVARRLLFVMFCAFCDVRGSSFVVCYLTWFAV